MTDIVTQLRESNGMTTSRSDDGFLSIHSDTDLLRLAADEIERLRADRDRWHDIANGLATHIEKASSNNARALQDYDNMVYKEIYGD